MRFVMLAGLAIAMVSTAANAGSNTVRGYVKRDGTYVMPHARTNPNATTHDNWSTRPNVNPYTGKIGTKDPYALPKRKGF